MAGEFSRSGRHYRSPTTDEALQGVRRPEDALSLIEKASFRIAGGSRFGGDDYMSPGGRSAELESLTELRPKNQATRNHVGLAMRPMSARSLIQIFFLHSLRGDAAQRHLTSDQITTRSGASQNRAMR
jgi:hypothetical protein